MWSREVGKEGVLQECLEHLLLGIHEDATDELLESYDFTFGYADLHPKVSVSRSSGGKHNSKEGNIAQPVFKAVAKKQTESVKLVPTSTIARDATLSTSVISCCSRFAPLRSSLTLFQTIPTFLCESVGINHHL